jgi:hypothetical protein
MSRSRQQLCGFQPSQVAGASSVAPSANVPNPLDTEVAGLPSRGQQPVEAPAVAPEATGDDIPTEQPRQIVRIPTRVNTTATPTATTAQAPEPTQVLVPQPQTPLPAPTENAVNPLTDRPASELAPRAPVATASPSPRVITAPEPVAQPRILTRAQACAGCVGIQPNLISQRTGEPINCGGEQAPQVATAAPAPTAEVPMTPVRLNRAQAFADSRATGRQYLSARTGLPIQCGSLGTGFGLASLEQIRADLRLLQRPYSNPLGSAPGSIFAPVRRRQAASTSPVAYSNPLDRAPGSMTFTPNVNTAMSRGCSTSMSALRCGPQAQSPSAAADPVVVTRARNASTGSGGLNQLFNQDPPPYSTPPAATLWRPLRHRADMRLSGMTVA